MGLKIWVVCQDQYREGKNDTLIVVDVIFSALIAIIAFGIGAAYTVLYIKFMHLINTSNGFLDFMRMQTHLFFVIIFIILSLKIIGMVADPIEFDILKNIQSGQEVLNHNEMIWLSVLAISQAFAEIIFDIMMIVYLI